MIFTDVPGSLKGSRVLVNFFGGKRKNMTLGFPSDLSKLELSEQFDGTSGYEKSVRDLTWSYAAFLSAVRTKMAKAS